MSSLLLTTPDAAKRSYFRSDPKVYAPVRFETSCIFRFRMLRAHQWKLTSSVGSLWILGFCSPASRAHVRAIFIEIFTTSSRGSGFADPRWRRVKHIFDSRDLLRMTAGKRRGPHAHTLTTCAWSFLREVRSVSTLGNKGGAVVRALPSHQCVQSSISGPGVTWVDIVVGSLLALEGFSPRTPVFPSPQKLTLLRTRNRLQSVPFLVKNSAWGENLTKQK